MIKILPREITSYDLLKAMALVIMIIDHTGAFFFPQDLWFRAIGRIGFPIWVFLIGYSNNRHVPAQMWIGGAIVTATFAASGMYLFPVNALFTLALARLLIDPVMKAALKNYLMLVLVFAALVILIPFTRAFFEYGTLVMLFAMFGYMRRHKDSLRIDPWALLLFVAAICLVFLVTQVLLYPFSAAQFAVMALGTLALCAILFMFRPVAFPRLNAGLGLAAPVIRFMGRRTLEIYVFHLTIFAVLAAILRPGPDFMAFDWINPAMFWFGP